MISQLRDEVDEDDLLRVKLELKASARVNAAALSQ